MKAIIPAIVLVTLIDCGSARAQHGHSGHDGPLPGAGGSQVTAEIEELIEQVRQVGERYRNRSAAIQDGFRRLGPDFPAMGEHWIHPRRMVSGELNIEGPQALSYILVGGEPRLTGVIYAAALAAGQPPPQFLAGATGWHDHSETIDEEAFLLQLDMRGDGGLRLSMLHVWVWPENPDSPFAPENWALPYVRLSLTPPPDPDPVSARALSLVSGGAEYYRQFFRLLVEPDAQDAAIADDFIERGRAEVEVWLQKKREVTEVGESDRILLAEVWQRLWSDMARSLSAGAAERLSRGAGMLELD